MSSINIPDCLIYLTNEDGSKYYYATQDSNGYYVINPSTLPKPIVSLPEKWEESEVVWARSPEYLGIFRSQSTNFTFIKDARAILLSLFYSSGGGIQANCVLRIDVFVDVNTGYKTAYKSEIDFTELIDNKFQSEYVGTGGNPIKEGKLEISTISSRMYSLVESLSNVDYNVPIWINSGTTVEPVWVPNEDVKFIFHNGIKLLYQANYVSTAQDSPTNLLDYRHNGNQILGWNKGARGSGYHTILSLAQYNIVQNNGTTTFIGNDILQPFLIQNNQNPGAIGFSNERFFDQANCSKPYSTSNNSLRNLLSNSTGTCEVEVSCEIQFSSGYTGTIKNTTPPKLYLEKIPSTTGYYLSFVLFEINKDDNPTVDSSMRWVNPIEVLRINIPDSSTTEYELPNIGYYNNISSPISMTLNYDKAYIFGIIFDCNEGVADSVYCAFELSNLNFTISSKFDNGISGVPIPAPSLNQSVFPAMSIFGLLKKVVKNLNTTNTDNWGFPIDVVGNPYSATSEILSNASLPPIGDLIPANILITSSYCLHNLMGQSYISISLNKIFDLCKKQIGCGMSIQDNGNVLEIERLSKYFDKDTQIYDLGTNVAKLVIKPFNDFAGSNLKLGYSKANTNSDFGIDSFCTELFFNTPLTKKEGTIDWEETSILTEQYAIEKIRAQKVSQPIGIGYDPSSPSSNNENIAFYCSPISIASDLPMYDPSNQLYATHYYPIIQRNGSIYGGSLPVAQSNDPSAMFKPYIFGMYYPDSAINVELSPCRALQRDGGAFLHSVLDLMDEEYLTFRNTSVIQYNNTVENIASIQSNLVTGGSGNLVTEFRDIKISELPSKLFRPFILELETVSPVNLYEIMATNPNGYIRFVWKGIIFMGFIWQIIQKIFASKPTQLELICHPDITNQQLINA